MRYECFIGSFSKEADAAIVRCMFDSQTGSLTEINSIPATRPSYLCLNEHNNVLYCVNEAETVNDVPGGSVESYDITNGLFRRISSQSTHSAGPCYLCICDDILFACNYTGGALTQFTLNEDRILPANAALQYFGHGTDAKRQSQPHIHFAALSPDKTHLAVCDLGTDSIYLYPYTAGNGISLRCERISAPAGSGPRHLAFGKDGRYLYVIAEMASSILVYDLRRSPAVLIQEISARVTLEGHSQCGGIRMTPDGKTIIAANRGDDTLTSFRVNEDGKLCLESAVPTGLWPRDHVFSPDGNRLLCANQNENTIGVYRMEGTASGAQVPVLTNTVEIHHSSKPSCIVFGNIIR